MTKSYTSGALDVITESQFQILPDTYVYAKVSKMDNTTDHFLITKDETEITIVTTLDKLKTVELVERNKDDYRLIALDVSVPFYSCRLSGHSNGCVCKQRHECPRGINLFKGLYVDPL